jgi:hypothetical protein
MQHFDGEIEKLIRAGTVEFETGMSYATNSENLRLERADFLEERATGTLSAGSSGSTEIEIEREASPDSRSLAKIGYPVAGRSLTLEL